jgi:hypothetical protein
MSQERVDQPPRKRPRQQHATPRTSGAGSSGIIVHAEEIMTSFLVSIRLDLATAEEAVKARAASGNRHRMSFPNMVTTAATTTKV